MKGSIKLKFCDAVPDLSQDSAPSLSALHESFCFQRLQEPGEEERNRLGAVPEVIDVRSDAGDDYVGEGVVAGEARYDVRATLKSHKMIMQISSIILVIL